MPVALPGVSVVIVNYHTPQAIDTALEVLLLGDRTLELDVLVVDQEPSDAERRHHHRWSALPGVRVVPSPTNLGFAGGCNLGSEHAKHEWLLFLNSDAWMTQENVAVLLDAAVTAGALAAGPLSNRASDVQTLYTWNATRRFPTPASYRAYQHSVDEEPFGYHRLSGVCLLVRADAFAETGRFERSYGLGYYEDDELTLRLSRRGLLLVVPRAFVLHQDGLSWRGAGREGRNLAMYVNRMLFLYRNYTSLLEEPSRRPLVSVVVTTFNRPGLLRHALESIAAQTHSRVEVVVVDDAGCDVSDVVEEALAGRVERVQHLVNERNLGKPASINRALAATSGELIAYLDDDDAYLPHHLLAAANALTQAGDLDAVYFGSVRRKVDAQGATVSREVVSNEWDVLRLLAVNLLPNCALVHRRSLLDRTGVHRDLPAIEDWDFLRRASLAGRFLHLPLVTSEFRVRGDADSRNGLIRRSFDSYMSVERQIRVGAPLLKTSEGDAPEVWQVLASSHVPRPHEETPLVSLQRQSGLTLEVVENLRPDVFGTHLRDEQPTVERAYAALLCAAGQGQQVAAVSALIVHYLRSNAPAAAARLHGMLSYNLYGTDMPGSGNVLATGRRVYEREGLRGLRELSVLSAKRRSRQFLRRVADGRRSS